MSEKTYTLKSVRPLGDNDPKFGQTFWCETHDQPEPLMFNLVGQNVGEGATISAEIVELKTSGKGTAYHRLKKVKVLNQQPQPPQESMIYFPPAPNDTHKTLELILDNTTKILKLVEPKSLGEAWRATTKQEPDEVVDVDPDEPINLSDIPF